MNPQPSTRRSWKRRAAWLSITAVIAAGVIWFFPGLLHLSSRTDGSVTDTVASNAPTPVTITTGRVDSRSVQRSVDVVGTLYGYEEIIISANVEGRVRSHLVDVGDRIAADAAMAEIDPTNYEMSVRQSRRSLDVELARLGIQELPTEEFDIEQLPPVRQARARLTLATRTEARTRELANSNAVATQDLESAISDSQTAQAEYENQLLLARAALATINMRQESLQIAEQQLRDTIIIAPSPVHEIPFSTNANIFAVSARNISEGTFLRPGSEVFRLVIDSALRLRVSVPERHLASIVIGQPAEVSSSAYAEPIMGKVSMINPVITPETRTYEVEILIDNSARRLKPGGFAKARIITQQNDQAISVPLEAIVTFAGITKIFLVENNIAQEVQVTPGQQGLDWVEIAAPPIAPGAVVVTSGQTALSNDTPVVVRKDDSISVATGSSHGLSASPASTKVEVQR